MTIDEYLNELHQSKIKIQEFGLIINEMIKYPEGVNPEFVKELIDYSLSYLDLIEVLIHEHMNKDTFVEHLQQKLQTINKVSHINK